MASLIRVSVVALLATGLFACGGSRIAPNREAAADAAFAASRGAGGAQGMVRAALMSPVTSTTTVDCPNGGSASMVIDADSIDTSGNFTFDLTYNNCNYDGETSMSGSLSVGFSFITDGSTSFDMALTMSGRVNFSGAISDFVEMDIVETVSANSLSATSGSVTVTLDGTITTSSGTYTYENETITVTADGIDAEG